MIKISNLHKSFNGVEVLKGINLDIRKGEVVAVIGPSGTGKSTLLRCMNFLEKPEKGNNRNRRFKGRCRESYQTTNT